MQDSIDKRNEKERIAGSVIKRWNVHYQSREELKKQEEQKEDDRMKEAQAILDRLQAETAADEEKKRREIEDAMRAAAQAPTQADYNASTNAYSGAYGKQQVTDEATMDQINQILGEKKRDFEAQLVETLEKNKF